VPRSADTKTKGNNPVIQPSIDFLTPLERLTIFTPFGIRFWDSARQLQVSEGLMVTARPQGTRHTATPAFRTASGVYAFHGLPGLRAVEYPAQEPAPTGSPPATTRFIIEVIDQQQRFLPVVFHADLPYYGIFPTETLSSPPGGRLPGFYLFSSPTRPAMSSLAVVRAQLSERIDAVTRRPAAYAVVEVRISGQATAYGLADERGGLAVMFPYPTFTATPVGSPPGTPLVAVEPQHWLLSLSVRYDPAALSFPAATTLPDLRSIFSQAPGVLWPTVVGQPVSQLSAVLTFGQELVLRTAAESELLIGAAASPP
jgi:hypothetical protein